MSIRKEKWDAWYYEQMMGFLDYAIERGGYPGYDVRAFKECKGHLNAYGYIYHDDVPNMGDRSAIHHVPADATVHMCVSDRDSEVMGFINGLLAAGSIPAEAFVDPYDPDGAIQYMIQKAFDYVDGREAYYKAKKERESAEKERLKAEKAAEKQKLEDAVFAEVLAYAEKCESEGGKIVMSKFECRVDGATQAVVKRAFARYKAGERMPENEIKTAEHCLPEENVVTSSSGKIDKNMARFIFRKKKSSELMKTQILLALPYGDITVPDIELDTGLYLMVARVPDEKFFKDAYWASYGPMPSDDDPDVFVVPVKIKPYMKDWFGNWQHVMLGYFVMMESGAILLDVQDSFAWEGYACPDEADYAHDRRILESAARVLKSYVPKA